MKTSAASLTELKKLWKKRQAAALEELHDFLRFPSISADPKHRPDCQACAEWLEKAIRAIGFDVEVWKTSSNPVLLASQCDAGPKKPTLLLYNHYDVQPIDPLSEWRSPPFMPTIREGDIHARGASDNKGQCFFVLEALRLLRERDGGFPLNIKWCIEGDEEVGSVALSEIAQKKRKKLAADYLVVVDSGMRDADVPAVTLGSRGLVTMTVTVRGAKGDLHSGSHGGIVFNPLHALVTALSKLRDDQGRITVPGFYDDIKALSPRDQALLALDFDAAAYTEQCGGAPLGGEMRYSPWERAWLRPTLEVNGLSGGYEGPGFKTVIPATAMAKISCRLVPYQEPLVVANRVADFLKAKIPGGMDVDITIHPGMGAAVRTSPTSGLVHAIAQAYEDVFRKKCAFILEGGSIPIAPQLAKASGAQVVLMGLSLMDDHVHAPNEHFGIDRLEKGIYVIARAIESLAVDR